MATLYHDDVMDEAALRRGADSANARWDNSVAILTGDWLFARASDLVADSAPRRSGSRPAPSAGWSRARSARPSVSQPDQDPLAHYLSVVADKTGSLIATSALFGARFAGASAESVQETLRAFGEEIGQAFQLADDILDVRPRSPASPARRPARTCAKVCRPCRC